jgi:4-amino-4-deoxy-L-arabinose transferase-like glycosyltransferase
MATTPVAALMFRFNNPDALLVLLMTAAAYAVTRAIEAGKTRWLVLAGALLGFGFLTKMLQAFLVLPGFALVYLVTGPRGLGRRIWQLLVSGAAVLLSAGWWVAAVMLTPAADRPYVGGSTNDSILQLAFGYNGLGRLDGNETGSVGFGGHGGGGFGFSGSTGLTRLFAADMGSQISWLLPAALIALAALLWGTRRAPRTDRTRAAALLWGGWLLVTGGVFSYMAGIIHPYYTIALAPAIAALAGNGAVQLWRVRDGWRGHENNWFGRVVLAAGVAVTSAWSYVLLGRAAGWQPWLRTLILVAGLVAVVTLLAGRWLSSIAATRPGRLALAAVPVPFALVAALAGPVAYSLDTVATAHTGALPSAGPTVASFGGPGGAGGFGGAGAPGSASGFGRGGAPSGASGFGPPGGSGSSSGLGRGGVSGSGPGGSRASGRAGAFPGRSGGLGGRGGTSAGGFGGLGGNTQVSSALTTLLKDGASGYRWAAATVSSDSAAPLQLASGEPVMSIGGFNGTDPAPTLAQFKRYVAEHDIHYFVGANAHSFGGGSGDAAQITAWVKAHFRAQTIGGETVYDLASR